MTIDVPPRQRWGFRGRGGQSEERGRQQSGSGTDQGGEQQAAVLRDTVKTTRGRRTVSLLHIGY